MAAIFAIQNSKQCIPTSLDIPSSSRKPLNLNQSSRLALKSTITSRTPYISYDHYHIGGYIFFSARLKLSDDIQSEAWVIPHLPCFKLFPLANSVTVENVTFFSTKCEAQQYAMLCACFFHDLTFLHNKFLPHYFNSQSGYVVVYDPDSLPKTERKKRSPFAGFVKYCDGVVGVRLLLPDGCWMEDSKMHYIQSNS